MPLPRFTTGKEPPVPIGSEGWWAQELVCTERLEEKSRTSALKSYLLLKKTFTYP